MATAVLTAAHFHDEAAAYEFVEARVWPQGRVCPHCGTVGQSGKLAGKSTRLGVYKCYACRKPFSVKVGTIFESSHVALHLWLQAIFMLCSSKKGISSNQLHRTLGVTLKSAWFMSHRIREAMRTGAFNPFGSGGGAVEVDETFIGRDPARKMHRQGYEHKMKVLALVDRSSGQARSFVVEHVDTKTVMPIVRDNLSREAHIMTDEAGYYAHAGKDFSQHSTVSHRKNEYVRGDVYTNTVEGYFSIFKRGMRGVYQQCGKKHLHRYLAEFDFRYNNRVALGVNDEQRSDRALRGVVGKRLTYRRIGAA